MQRSSSVVCSLCKSDLIITDSESAEVICGKCGMIILDKIQENNRPEWRAFNSEEVNKKNRSGAPASLAYHDMGLSTVIGKTDRDASGRKIDAPMHSTMKRLRIWDFRTKEHSSTDRSLMLAFNELDILKDKLGLSNTTVEKAAYIYRKAQRRGLIKGRSIIGLLTAAVYVSCREMGIPRTLKDMNTSSNVKRKSISRMYRLLVVELDLKVPLADPMKCIAKIANNANLTEKTKRKAMSIMNDISKKNMLAADGKDPMGFAATILYLSCLKAGESISQIDISRAAGVTEVTLRNRLKDIRSQIQ
ncbi:MAG TPA: TFIIB-type zinc ribbon-containing protein [Nitrososphaeraceae archaeon]|jgi:transcription initiation factor TFIIB|nr:TFIIB-type zinc ribbon-containing protein [Nitrososphaeraceae archaeon]